MRSQIVTFFIDVQIQKLLQSAPTIDMAPGAMAPSYLVQRAPILKTELQINESLTENGLSSARAIPSEHLLSAGHQRDF